MASSVLSPSCTIPGPTQNQQSEHEEWLTHQNNDSHYVTYRPSYPASLWSLVTYYHTGPLRTLHDVGCGPGNGAEALLTYLDNRPETNPIARVILSDPLPQCKTFWQSRFRHRTHIDFTFRTCGAETPLSDDKAGSVDLTTACQSLHWTDLPVALSAIAASLRPGGTMMGSFYGPFPRVVDAPAGIAEAFQGFIDEHVASLQASSWMEDVDAPGRAKYKKGSEQMCHGHESTAEAILGMGPGVWADVKLVEVNCEEEWVLSEMARRMSERLGTERMKRPVLDARVERVGKREWDWRREGVTLGWAREMLVSVGFGFGKKSWEMDGWKRLESVWGDKKVTLEWQVHVLLARKK